MTEYTFYYEDFVTDISNYLKQKEKDFIQYSVDPCAPLASVDKNKLAIILSNFWLNKTE